MLFDGAQNLRIYKSKAPLFLNRPAINAVIVQRHTVVSPTRHPRVTHVGRARIISSSPTRTSVRLGAAGAPPLLLALARQPVVHRLLHAVLTLVAALVDRARVGLRAAGAPPLLLTLARQPVARLLQRTVLALLDVHAVPRVDPVGASLLVKAVRGPLRPGRRNRLNDPVSVVSWLDKLYGIVLRKFHFKLLMLPFGANIDYAPTYLHTYIPKSATLGA